MSTRATRARRPQQEFDCDRVARCAPHPNKVPTHVARDGFTCQQTFRACEQEGASLIFRGTRGF
jgi:hypothetical protein